MNVKSAERGWKRKLEGEKEARKRSGRAGDPDKAHGWSKRCIAHTLAPPCLSSLFLRFPLHDIVPFPILRTFSPALPSLLPLSFPFFLYEFELPLRVRAFQRAAPKLRQAARKSARESQRSLGVLFPVHDDRTYAHSASLSHSLSLSLNLAFSQSQRCLLAVSCIFSKCNARKSSFPFVSSSPSSLFTFEFSSLCLPAPKLYLSLSFSFRVFLFLPFFSRLPPPPSPLPFSR